MGVEHILTEIINRPLYITPDKLSIIMGVLNKKADNPINLDLSDLMPAIGSDANGGAVQSRARTVNQPSSKPVSVAVVGALGSLVNRNHGFGDGSGLRSYRTLQIDIQACLDDPEIGGILIDMDSYGGISAGCERATRFIKYADSIKPIYAVVDLNCFSACYSIASACRKIILTDASAGVGSVGCIAIHRDLSKKHEQDGEVYTAVFFGARKNDFSPLEPLTKDMRAKLQRSVDTLGMRFAQTVAEFRGISLEKVLATEAGVYYGQDAINAGLADEIASFDEAVAMLAAEIEATEKPTFTGGSAMTTKDRMEKLLTAEDGPEALADLGYVLATTADQATTEAVSTATDSLKKQMIDVAEIAQLAQLPMNQTVTMLKEGLTAEQARENIQQIRANDSQQTVVQSTTTSFTGDGKHPLLAACEKLNK